MGGCFSSKPSFTINNVRLVHLSGYVEDFENPISVSQVTGTPPKHFVCTSVQLLSSCSKPLNGDTQLQPGNVYFMLPYSILQADVSPVDLASLAKRLTAIAKTRSRRLEGKKSSSLKDGSFSSNVWSSPSRSPGRLGGVVEQIGMPYGGPSPCRVRPWKPILDTIREKSFNRRSESDLQEHN
ncbi:hypothetical protein AAZX31_09G056500 [Glycine max]|uniref:DUF4228 domain-containing protein n=1 Tax=Glycine soja TaxID=3848 RepID=A0A445IXD1_GLYSO|nr:uncharacterized protein LOC114425567 [Glycine soja]KAG5132946.1 hypothetical protein JHK82_024134 [Glycine max]KAG4990637.1 hypothetical protein JHK87_024094 [Glycine soja]KHN35803.1 hypothetical protein glysoja_013228 [Glycine soja]RZB90801.1 hypothetical protein D0Y65_023301 [Glycine soja]RZB90802.1 hypothetical protein D0Y65_023301 [Glycine soja]